MTGSLFSDFPKNGLIMSDNDYYRIFASKPSVSTRPSSHVSICFYTLWYRLSVESAILEWINSFVSVLITISFGSVFLTNSFMKIPPSLLRNASLDVTCFIENGKTINLFTTDQENSGVFVMIEDGYRIVIFSGD